jgi:hypothetical protein
MSNKYITLAPSNDTNGSLARRFRVLQEGYQRQKTKNQTIERAISGKPDITDGGVQTVRQLTIRVRHTEPDQAYGDLADLESFYGLNNPNGTPSNLLRFSRHDQDYIAANPATYTNVMMIGEYTDSPMAIFVEGEYAWYLVNITLMELP